MTSRASRKCRLRANASTTRPASAATRREVNRGRLPSGWGFSVGVSSTMEDGPGIPGDAWDVTAFDAARSRVSRLEDTTPRLSDLLPGRRIAPRDDQHHPVVAAAAGMLERSDTLGIRNVDVRPGVDQDPHDLLVRGAAVA